MVKKCDKTISMAESFGWKQGHGGKRDGAGRKKSAIRTITLRVPEELVPDVRKMIEHYRSQHEHTS